MLKDNEYKLENNIFKIYRVENMDVKRILEEISQSINDIDLYIHEDTDGEMMSINGTYNIEYLINNASELFAEALDYSSITVNISGNYQGEPISIVLNLSTNEIILVTENPNLELSQFINDNSNHISI